MSVLFISSLRLVRKRRKGKGECQSFGSISVARARGRKQVNRSWAERAGWPLEGGTVGKEPTRERKINCFPINGRTLMWGVQNRGGEKEEKRYVCIFPLPPAYKHFDFFAVVSSVEGSLGREREVREWLEMPVILCFKYFSGQQMQWSSFMDKIQVPGPETAEGREKSYWYHRTCSRRRMDLLKKYWHIWIH